MKPSEPLKAPRAETRDIAARRGAVHLRVLGFTIRGNDNRTVRLMQLDPCHGVSEVSACTGAA